MSTSISTAVFPVAGLGSRFLPATKATPKEMLPVVDKPLIQYAVEEAVEAGITKMIFVTGRNKRAIEDHFDVAYELETELAQKQKTDLLDVARSVTPDGVHFVFVRQSEALGLGHAILCAKPLISDSAFAVLLADDLIKGEVGVTKQLIDARADANYPVVGLQKIDISQSRSYGIIEPGRAVGGHVMTNRLIEKPAPESAPSNLAVVGRYILPFEIFEFIEQLDPGAGSEIQLTDALNNMATRDGVMGVAFEGTRFDCGSKSGYLEASVTYGLEHPETGERLRAYLKGLKL